MKEGAGKRGGTQEKERETLKNTQKCPFLWGKLSMKSKEKKAPPPKKKGEQKGKKNKDQKKD